MSREYYLLFCGLSFALSLIANFIWLTEFSQGIFLSYIVSAGMGFYLATSFMMFLEEIIKYWYS